MTARVTETGNVDGDTGPNSATRPAMMPFEMNW
jgi:hypothetical protein